MRSGTGSDRLRAMPSRPTLALALAAAIATGAIAAGCANDSGRQPPGITGSFPVGTTAAPLPTLGPDTIPPAPPKTSPGTTPGSAPGTLPPAPGGPTT
jgi:hypothetical protein